MVIQRTRVCTGKEAIFAYFRYLISNKYSDVLADGNSGFPKKFEEMPVL